MLFASAPCGRTQESQGDSLVTKVAMALAIVLAGASAPAWAGEHALRVVCRQAPATVAPTPQTATPAAAAACPSGQVPQPIGRIAPKGVPALRERAVPGVASDPDEEIYYFYASAYRQAQTGKAEGKFTQDQPYVAAEDYHSLAEMAGETADGQNIIEIGWTVDPSLNGDSNPHLFVFHWISGAPTCYNGCGYVQVSTTRYPGMTVAVSSTPQPFAFHFDGNNWWVGYQGEWIGYFPASLWAGQFTRLGLTQWFGEVAASSGTPCTQMGNGVIGTGTGAALVSSERIADDPGPPQVGEVTDPSYYALGAITGTGNHFGGPGGC
jgi:hypothetical protein